MTDLDREQVSTAVVPLLEALVAEVERLIRHADSIPPDVTTSRIQYLHDMRAQMCHVLLGE